jgi:hypothetical protein
MLGLSYNNKHRKPDAYIAPRADSVFNTKDYTVDIDSPADQTAGLDLNYTVSEKGHNIYGRAYYDVNQKKFSRGEINARFNLTKQLGFSAGYLYREPQLSYNSIFWVFSYSKNQEIEGGLDYMFNGNYNAFARVSDVFYDGASSLKFQAGVNHPAFGISFIKYSGYSGESDGVYGYLATELIKTKLTGTLSGNYSNYKISEYSTDKLDAFSGVLGLTYKPSYRFSVDAQGQFMTNRIYKSDVRFLFGVNYWLFTKL